MPPASHPKPCLHILCGKIASGKSTLAHSLAAQEDTVLLSEDAWIDGLYSDAIKTPRDYFDASRKLRAVLRLHVIDLLRSGLSVVLDFQANTVESRVWMRSVITEAAVAHKLHFLDTPDGECLARLRARNATGEHPFQVSDAQFFQVSAHFVAPTPEEDFAIVTYPPTRLRL